MWWRCRSWLGGWRLLLRWEGLGKTRRIEGAEGRIFAFWGVVEGRKTDGIVVGGGVWEMRKIGIEFWEA